MGLRKRAGRLTVEGPVWVHIDATTNRKRIHVRIDPGPFESNYTKRASLGEGHRKKLD
jgi:hypothetical protein